MAMNNKQKKILGVIEASVPNTSIDSGGMLFLNIRIHTQFAHEPNTQLHPVYQV